jgi:hypothetical protein
MMDAVVSDNGVYRGVKFDPTDFRTTKLPFCPYIVNMVVLYGTEGCTHGATHTRLFAIVNGVVPDNMRSDILLVPAISQHPENHLYVMNVAVVVYTAYIGRPNIMSCTMLFSKGYP